MSDRGRSAALDFLDTNLMTASIFRHAAAGIVSDVAGAVLYSGRPVTEPMEPGSLPLLLERTFWCPGSVSRSIETLIENLSCSER